MEQSPIAERGATGGQVKETPPLNKEFITAEIFRLVDELKKSDLQEYINAFAFAFANRRPTVQEAQAIKATIERVHTSIFPRGREIFAAGKDTFFDTIFVQDVWTKYTQAKAEVEGQIETVLKWIV